MRREVVTGAIEWDHLGDWERRRNVRDTFALGLFLSTMSSILGLILYLVLDLILGPRRSAVVAALIIAAATFFVVQITFWPGVAASMCRTRFGTSMASEGK